MNVNSTGSNPVPDTRARGRIALLLLFLVNIILTFVSLVLLWLPVYGNWTFTEWARGGSEFEALYLPFVVTIPVAAIGCMFVALAWNWFRKKGRPPHPAHRAWKTLVVLWTIVPVGYIGGFIYKLDESTWGVPYDPTFTTLVPARDGYLLETRVYMPGDARVGDEGYTGPYPVLYLKDSYDWNGAGWGDNMGKYWSGKGFVVVHQLCRGLEVSPAAWNTNHEWEFAWQDYHDGRDTVDWIARQPWCNGKVVMDGMSYTGWTQWATAMEAPPALAGIMPGWMGANPYEFFYYNGMLALDFTMGWLAMMYGIPGAGDVYSFDGPLVLFDDHKGRDIPAWNDLLMHPVQDDYWTTRGMSPGRVVDVQVPIYSTTGWWDFFAHSQLKDFEMIYTNGSTITKNHSRLTVGPWGHGAIPLGEFPEEVLPSAQSRTGREDQEAFYNACISGSGIPESNVTIWLNGAWEWISASRLPWPGVTPVKYYFHQDGGQMFLNETMPGTGEDANFTSYIYDPTNTEYLSEEIRYGYTDHSNITARDDHLLFTMDVPANFTVIGAPKLYLWAETNCTDTDWVVEILDIYPDGRQMFLAHGAMRAQARDGISLKDVPAGTAVLYKIDVMHLANRFLEGHKLGIAISSSKYPVFVRNTNTGNVLLSAETVVANNSIHHDTAHASFIELPVLP